MSCRPAPPSRVHDAVRLSLSKGTNEPASANIVFPAGAVLARPVLALGSRRHRASKPDARCCGTRRTTGTRTPRDPAHEAVYKIRAVHVFVPPQPPAPNRGSRLPGASSLRVAIYALTFATRSSSVRSVLLKRVASHPCTWLKIDVSGLQPLETALNFSPHDVHNNAWSRRFCLKFSLAHGEAGLGGPRRNSRPSHLQALPNRVRCAGPMLYTIRRTMKKVLIHGSIAVLHLALCPPLTRLARSYLPPTCIVAKVHLAY